MGSIEDYWVVPGATCEQAQAPVSDGKLALIHVILSIFVVFGQCLFDLVKSMALPFDPTTRPDVGVAIDFETSIETSRIL